MSNDLIKVCVDETCLAVYHNISVNDKRCHNCDGKLIRIDENTWYKKFNLHPFQIDYQTRDFYKRVKDIPNIKQREFQTDMFEFD